MKFSITDCHEFAKTIGYKCLSSEYINANSKLTWICDKGHEWEATFGHIRYGARCKYCYYKKVGDSKRGMIGDCYEFVADKNIECLENVYVNSGTRMRWRCLVCGHIWIAPFNRLKNKHGCPKCARCIKHTLEYCKEVASNKGWECLSETYKNARTKMKWKCAGLFGTKHIVNLTFNTFLNNADNKLGCVYCDRDRRNIFKKNDKYCLVGHNEYYYFKPFIEKYFSGYKIIRQSVVFRDEFKNPFYVDFVIKELNLAIEYDEAHHKTTKDEYRQQYIEKKEQLKFIRIDDIMFMTRGKKYFEEIFKGKGNVKR